MYKLKKLFNWIREVRNIDKLEVMTKHECYQESFERHRKFVYKIKFRCFKNVYMVHPRDVWKTDLMACVVGGLCCDTLKPFPTLPR
jgi:hypothetical protein